MSKLKRALLRVAACMIAVLAGGHVAWGDVPFNYHASVTAQASSKSLAPYMLGSWNYGRYVEGSGIWQEAGFDKELDLSKRFSWSVGLDYIAGAGSKTYYDRWDESSQTWTKHNAHLPYVRFQQLYGQLKYRAAFLTIGMKYSHSFIVDDQLSSGDVSRSNNAMPIPAISIGFLDFVDIPFTRGWVQINGELTYGKRLDSGFLRNEFNYYYGGIYDNILYNYKRCYFRTNPEKNFHITIGMQATGLFGGATYKYNNGKIYSTSHRGFRFKDIFQMFFPMEGGENYYTGSHLGSWDFKADYRFKDGSNLSAYFEWPWEDGSGIGKMNGWDGLWGIQYNFARKGIISKALVEYIDFTNQSGPIHYDPEDNPQNPITGHAQGADDYYNNAYYGPFTNYSMGIGSPFLLSPIYNRNGDLSYLHNRARGFHAAIEGDPIDWLSYTIMAGYELAGGNGPMPAYRRLSCTSGMISVTAHPFRKIPELELGLRMAFDAGDLRGDNFGAGLHVAYKGLFNLKKAAK